MMNALYRFTVLASVLCTIGCTPKPVLYPNARFHEVGQAAAQRDIQDCRKTARSAGTGPGTGKAGQAAEHMAIGAAAGAASGAVGGALTGSAITGAEAGAASGATWGLLSSLFTPAPPDATYVGLVNRCLSERGYEVAGWE
jgi:hypothetical protein